jgi:transposase
MGDLSDFERGQIVRARLAGAFVIKTAILLGVSRATVSKVMSAYTNHGKTTSAKRNSGRKSTLTERDRRTFRRTVSKNQRTTAAQVTGQQNWIFILKTLFQQKLTDVSFANPTSAVGLQLLDL